MSMWYGLTAFPVQASRSSFKILLAPGENTDIANTFLTKPVLLWEMISSQEPEQASRRRERIQREACMWQRELQDHLPGVGSWGAPGCFARNVTSAPKEESF